MIRHLGIVVLLGLLAATAFGQQPTGEDRLPQSPEGKAWKLAWHDEFNGSTLDESKWETPPDGKRRDAWWMREAVSLDGKGHLVMRTFKERDRYIDGCVRTRGKFEHAFGYYVARVKLQKQPGHWSAFWLYNTCVGKIGDQGRDGSEIDIMEKPWLDDRIIPCASLTETFPLPGHCDTLRSLPARMLIEIDSQRKDAHHGLASRAVD